MLSRARAGSYAEIQLRQSGEVRLFQEKRMKKVF